MLNELLSFADTPGVIRFDRPVDDVMETIMPEGHEDHYGIVHRDVRRSSGRLLLSFGFA